MRQVASVAAANVLDMIKKKVTDREGANIANAIHKVSRAVEIGHKVGHDVVVIDEMPKDEPKATQ